MISMDVFPNNVIVYHYSKHLSAVRFECDTKSDISIHTKCLGSAAKIALERTIALIPYLKYWAVDEDD